MMRRAAAAAPRVISRAQQTTVARRGNAAPAWVKPELVKIYEAGFESAQYPEEMPGGDHLIFSKLLFQFACAEKKEAKYVQDITKGLAKAQMEIGAFWADENIGENKAFNHLEPGVRFVLRWMQVCGQMNKIDDVVTIFRMYVNAKNQTMTASVVLPGLPSSSGQNLAAAKQAAEAVFKSSFPTKSSWKLDYEVLVDPGIIAGWRVNVGGMVVEDMTAYRAAAEEAKSSAATIDYTAVPATKSRATPWAETIETDVLSSWCSELSTWDLEEQKHGV